MQIWSCKICLKPFHKLKIKPKLLWMVPNDFFSTSTSRWSVPALPASLWAGGRPEDWHVDKHNLHSREPFSGLNVLHLPLTHHSYSFSCLSALESVQILLTFQKLPDTSTLLKPSLEFLGEWLVLLCACNSLSAYFCDGPPSTMFLGTEECSVNIYGIY